MELVVLPAVGKSWERMNAKEVLLQYVLTKTKINTAPKTPVFGNPPFTAGMRGCLTIYKPLGSLNVSIVFVSTGASGSFGSGNTPFVPKEATDTFIVKEIGHLTNCEL
jgi:hypothetical protein